MILLKSIRCIKDLIKHFYLTVILINSMICKTRFLIQCKICKEPVVYTCLRLRVATKSDKKSKNCKTLTQTPTRIQKYKRKTRDLSPDLPNKYCLDKIYPSTMELSSGLSISCSRKFLETNWEKTSFTSRKQEILQKKKAGLTQFIEHSMSII